MNCNHGECTVTMVKVENIKVAVRVRPFNVRENAKSCQSIISMLEKTTLITNPANTAAPPRQFRFDYSYWSHDGFNTNEDGYLEPNGTEYADQSRLFDELGVGLLDNAWSGYNCTLFTYGQTGSGKTYSMLGYGPNKGLVPMLSEKLFDEISRKGEHPGIVYQVSCSMLEIYNEKVRDLLNKGEQPKQGLPVRMNPKGGFYVEGLVTSPVADYRSLQYQMEEGNKNRTLAATKMNETSSASSYMWGFSIASRLSRWSPLFHLHEHLIKIDASLFQDHATANRAHTLVIISFVQNYIRENRTKQSRIYMVDLAGSERASQTGATGVRFEESKSINRSLMTLGTVIKNLCAIASGRTDQGPVPYRDSKLTMLLKDAIGGNSKTIMVATISPTDEAYEQTLSTLRYADRVKSIKNFAKMNVDATDKLIKELLAEKEELLTKLKNKPDARIGYTEDEIKRLREEQLAEIGQIKSQMLNVETAWQKRLQETKLDMEKQLERERKEQKDRAEIPHLWNLNEDPTLSGKVYYVIREGKPVTVGNARATKQPTMELHGPSIAKEHVFLQNRKSVVTLYPLQGHVKINGVPVAQQTILKHHDRIFFSANSMFVFHHPQEEQQIRKAGKVTKTITYELAQHEIAKHSQVDASEDNEWLRQDVAETLVRTQDANSMATEMERDVVFDPIVIAQLVLGQDLKRSQIYVRVRTGSGGEFIWSRNHFLDRFDLMMDMFQKFENGDPSWQPKTKTQDPFWEPLETPTLIGVAYIPLESIAYMLDIEEQKIGIYDYQAYHVGYMSVSLVPCTEEEDECSEERAVEEPIDLLGHNITFKLKIKGATGIPKRFKSSWCHYTFCAEQDRHYTDEVLGAVPKYNFEHTHRMTKLSQNMIEYLEEKSIMVEIYGRQSGSTDVRRGSTLNTYTILNARRLSNFSSVLTDDGGGKSRTSMGSEALPDRQEKGDERIGAVDTTPDCDDEDSTLRGCNSQEDSVSAFETVPLVRANDIADSMPSYDNCDNIMEEMRKGISSVMNEVLKRNGNIDVDEMEDSGQPISPVPLSHIAANTSFQIIKEAYQSNTEELTHNRRNLLAANQKLEQVYSMVHNRTDTLSLGIKRILADI